MHVVTISATYGAGGALVGPEVAERLGVPFVDRAVPVAVADDLGITLDDALSRDEQCGGWLSRLLTATAPLSAEWMIGPDHPRTALLPDSAVLRCTEGVIRKAVRDGGGVILGRAAAIVLRDHPGAVHVRLDGDPEARVRQAMTLQGMSERDAREAMVRNDKARTTYVRHFYGADPADPRHYDLVIDSTRVPLKACTELIVVAAESCRA
jgi:cytidylate kinase